MTQLVSSFYLSSRFISNCRPNTYQGSSSQFIQFHVVHGILSRCREVKVLQSVVQLLKGCLQVLLLIVQDIRLIHEANAKAQLHLLCNWKAATQAFALLPLYVINDFLTINYTRGESQRAVHFLASITSDILSINRGHLHVATTLRASMSKSFFHCHCAQPALEGHYSAKCFDESSC